MTETGTVKSVRVDPTLLSRIRRFGRFDVQACLNCGGCTIVCDVQHENASFPRRPIRYALLGLKEPLLGSLEPWLCQDCGDCSVACPRQTEPAESMRTIRRYLTAAYDWTGLSSLVLSSRAWHLGSLAVVMLLVLGLIVWYHVSWVGMPTSEFATTAFPVEHMFGKIVWCTAVVYAIPLLMILTQVWLMWRLTMRGSGAKLRHYAAEAKTLLVQAVTQKQMRRCPQAESKQRWPGHWLMACGCALMFVLTCFFLRWFQTDAIYPLYHPQRWLGYLATAFLLYGTTEIIIGRIRKKPDRYKVSEPGDLAFPILLWLTTVTGIAIHVFRYTGLELATHYMYALHLMVTVPMVVIEIPFGKWAHMVYRPLAVYLQAVRDSAALRNEAVSVEAGMQPVRT